MNMDLDQARETVRDLFDPNPLIYWADFLFSITLGWAAFVTTLALPTFSPGQFVSYVVASLALYRSVIFIHELAHLKKGTFGFFRLVWNLTCGFALMVPSFTYRGVHNDHHKRDVYGTKDDGEYLPFGAESPLNIVAYLLLIFVLPLMAAGRFIVLTPISYLHRRLRYLLWERASSLTIDLGYRRPPPARKDEESWPLQEFAAFAYGASGIALVFAGILPSQVLILWYAIAVLIFLLNSLRTLAAHAYRNPGNQNMDFIEQYLDSVDVPGNPLLTPLWAPVGLRYHATHHLFPNMPYHSVGEAQRRIAAVPFGHSGPQLTVRSSLWGALANLWREAKAANKTT